MLFYTPWISLGEGFPSIYLQYMIEFCSQSNCESASIRNRVKLMSNTSLLIRLLNNVTLIFSFCDMLSQLPNHAATRASR